MTRPHRQATRPTVVRAESAATLPAPRSWTCLWSESRPRRHERRPQPGSALPTSRPPEFFREGAAIIVAVFGCRMQEIASSVVGGERFSQFRFVKECG